MKQSKASCDKVQRERDEARHARADRLAMAPVELSESVNEQRQAAAAAATYSTTSQLYHQTSDND